jgi:hypothetical protein
MDENGKKFIYWYHGDVCRNITYSDNLPATDKQYVLDELKDEGDTIKHKLSYNGHTRNIIVPKKEQKNPVYLRGIHNAVHKFLEDGKRESVKFVEAGKHQFCTRKQYEKVIATKK